MLLRQILLPSAIAPAVCAAVVWLLLGLLYRRPENGSGRSWGRGGLAVASGVLAGLVAATGWPRWPPVEATQRLVLLVVLAAAIGTVFAALAGNRRPAVRLGVQAVFGLALLAWVLESMLRHTWSSGLAALWMLGLLLAYLALCWAFERDLVTRSAANEGGRLSQWLPPVVRWTALAGTATVLGLSGSARLALLAGALTAGLFTVEVLARLFGRRPWEAGDGWPAASAAFGMLAIGHFYASLTLGSALLLFATLLLLGLPGRSAWLRLLPLAPLAVALALAAASVMAKEDDPYADYYSARLEASASVPPLGPTAPARPRTGAPRERALNPSSSTSCCFR